MTTKEVTGDRAGDLALRPIWHRGEEAQASNAEAGFKARRWVVELP